MKSLFIIISLFMTMVLGSPAHATTNIFSSNFEGTDWKENWEGAWIQGSDQSQSGDTSAKANAFNDGMFTSFSLDTSDAQSITVDFWFRKDDTDTGNDFLLYYYNGTSYNLITDLDTLGNDDTWLHYTDTISDSQYFKTNFRIRFEARNLSKFHSREKISSKSDLKDGRFSESRSEEKISSKSDSKDSRFSESHSEDRRPSMFARSSGENVWVDLLTVSIETQASDNDSDGDGYPEGQDCNDNNPNINPDAVDLCDDGIDQDCNGIDETCIPAPSCITNLDSWKLKYQPIGSGCTSCHTTCTPGGHSSRCTEGGPWGSMNCTNCHSNQH